MIPGNGFKKSRQGLLGYYLSKYKTNTRGPLVLINIHSDGNS